MTGNFYNDETQFFCDNPNINERDRYCIQSRQEAVQSRGRPVPIILHDRSVRGSKSIGGIRLDAQFTCVQNSPSSVIDARYSCVDRLENPRSSHLFFQPDNNRHRQSPTSNHFKINAYPTSVSNEIRYFAEQYLISKPGGSYITLNPEQNPSSDAGTNSPRRRSLDHAVSTISLAFSPDGRTMASTHGDHTVKVTCCYTGRLLRSLVGHLRTPWTVKYHPSNPNIIASGCLGSQVRIWDWNYRSKHLGTQSRQDINGNNHDHEIDNYEESKGICLYHYSLRNGPIISISFHPTGSLLAIASGSTLYLWDYADYANNEARKWKNFLKTTNYVEPTIDLSNTSIASSSSTSEGRKAMNVFKFGVNVKCVAFPPDGDTIIIGLQNELHGIDIDRRRRIEGENAGAGFSLRMFDFDLNSALDIGRLSNQPNVMERVRTPNEVMYNMRTVLARVLLYNDGGLDLSPDGRLLCACAEIWLPHGIDNIMNLAEYQKEIYPMNALNVDDNKLNDELSENEEASEQAQSPSRLTLPSISTDRVDGYRTPPPNPSRSTIPVAPPCLPGRRLETMPFLHDRRQRLKLIPDISETSESDTTDHSVDAATDGRFVPHVVMVSIDTTSPFQKLGQILAASPLPASKASGVTCVKYSPSTEFCLLGFGVRDKDIPVGTNESSIHPVVSIYRCRGGMDHIATVFSTDDDVNIARFHPNSGHSLAYGTKQGRLRVLSPMYRT